MLNKPPEVTLSYNEFGQAFKSDLSHTPMANGEHHLTLACSQPGWIKA